MRTLWPRPVLRPLAVLLDFDGTLVDTEPLWIQAEIDLLGSYGVVWTLEQARHLCGTSREFSSATMLAEMAAQGVDVEAVDEPEFYGHLWRSVADAIAAHGLPWLPGAVELLADLADHQVPCALVSSSPRPLLEAALRQFGAHSIQVVVSGDDVPASKPAPDPYLIAADHLGVAAADCVVIEDSVSGTASGRHAGAVVIGVPRMHPLASEPGQVVCESLEGLTTEGLQRVFAAVRAHG